MTNAHFDQLHHITSGYYMNMNTKILHIYYNLKVCDAAARQVDSFYAPQKFLVKFLIFQSIFCKVGSYTHCLQCFDIVGWVPGTASGL